MASNNNNDRINNTVKFNYTKQFCSPTSKRLNRQIFKLESIQTVQTFSKVKEIWFNYLNKFADKPIKYITSVAEVSSR